MTTYTQERTHVLGGRDECPPKFIKNNLKYTKKINFSSQNYTFVPPK
jgi:hypothetical protein